MNKTAAVIGSSGFIGAHLTRVLLSKGFHVVGADIRPPMFWSPSEFYYADARDKHQVDTIFHKHQFDEVYNMGCLMGGMGFIGDPKNNYDVMVGSSLVALNVLNAAVSNNTPIIFYPSSACVYPEFKQDELNCIALKEQDAYPAYPDMPYGWQKLFSEQIHEAAKVKGIKVRVARFHNVYGDHTIFSGGKEKAPAAICRKVAQATDGDVIEIWGDGKQVRSFMFIDDCLDGIFKLIESNYESPLNIGSDEAVSINELAQMVIDISGKKLKIKNIKGNQGVRFRNSDNDLCKQVLDGWSPKVTLREGIEKTYNWINKRING